MLDPGPFQSMLPLTDSSTLAQIVDYLLEEMARVPRFLKEITDLHPGQDGTQLIPLEKKVQGTPMTSLVSTSGASRNRIQGITHSEREVLEETEMEDLEADLFDLYEFKSL